MKNAARYLPLVLLQDTLLNGLLFASHKITEYFVLERTSGGRLVRPSTQGRVTFKVVSPRMEIATAPLGPATVFNYLRPPFHLILH